MARRNDFNKLCERVRFSLDEPIADEHQRDEFLADLVAQVRSSGLQVTHATVPELAKVVQRTIDALQLSSDPEVYVVNNPVANAFAPAFASGQRPMVVLNSGLVTLLTSNELVFTIAHELGHLGLSHGQRLRDRVPKSEFEALQTRSLLRFAEISADRVALVAARSVFVAAHVMVKLASGLPSDFLGLDVDAFVRQVERDPDETSRAWELEASHPALPFRLWSLLRFSHSEEYAGLSGQVAQGMSLEEIDAEIASRCEALGDGRLSEMEGHAYQMALVWAGMAMVMDDNLIERHERDTLERLIGHEQAMKAITFAEAQGGDAVLRKLKEAVDRVSASSLATRRKLEEAIKAFALALDLEPEETRAGCVVAAALRLV